MVPTFTCTLPIVSSLRTHVRAWAGPARKPREHQTPEKQKPPRAAAGGGFMIEARLKLADHEVPSRASAADDDAEAPPDDEKPEKRAKRHMSKIDIGDSVAFVNRFRDAQARRSAVTMRACFIRRVA